MHVPDGLEHILRPALELILPYWFLIQQYFLRKVVGTESRILHEENVAFICLGRVVHFDDVRVVHLLVDSAFLLSKVDRQRGLGNLLLFNGLNYNVLTRNLRLMWLTTSFLIICHATR